MWMKSMMESADPRRTKLLTDIALANCTKSSTDIVEHIRLQPKIAKAEPMRAMLRKDSVEPIFMKSITDNDEPKRPQLRIDNDDARVTYSRTDKDEAKREMP
mmetsp:Transcript_61196/g.107153  ORF Transcript_61196/g.107153 Transcript_61196/m.107153 type:complete len:102 (+) Transcript_61196:1433-1738(+)